MKMMREYQRKEVGVERPRLNLVRGVDGRLRSAGTEDITDIWAEQKRIHSAEAVTEERRRAERHDQPGKKIPSIAPVVDRLPKFKKPHFQLTALNNVWRRKYFLVAATILVVVVLGVVSYRSLGREDKKTQQPPPTTSTPNPTAAKSPEFSAILPAGRSIEDLGGWVRVSPADKDPVFAFVDSIGSVQLNVSQQELPANLQTNTAQEVEKLARGFAANEKIEVGGITAYLGTSIHGPQSVIFVENDLLVLIKSSGKLTTQQWANYIRSLQ